MEKDETGGSPISPEDTKPASRRRVPGWVLVSATLIGVVVAFVGVVLLLFLATGYEDADTAEPAEPTITTTVAEVTTSTIPETTTTTAPPTPTPIPGLTTSTVHGPLSSQGWICGLSDRQPSEGYVASSCRPSSSVGTVGVTTYATPADEVVFVEVSATWPRDEVPGMELVAGLVHDDAGAWVREMTTSTSSPDSLPTTLDGVRFELYGHPGPYWTLKIGIEP